MDIKEAARALKDGKRVFSTCPTSLRKSELTADRTGVLGWLGEGVTHSQAISIDDILAEDYFTEEPKGK